MAILTMIDILKIQEYISSSNKLKEIIGGSKLVEWATSKDGMLKGLVNCDKIIIGAGGNLLLKFENMKDAQEFSARYSRKLLDDAPGLECVICHDEYSDNKIGEAILNLQKKINEVKTCRQPSVPLQGLGITAVCRSTGKPASEVIQDGNFWFPVSKEIAKKREKVEKDDARAEKEINGKKITLLEPLDIDNIGRTKGEASLIGIVHIDGNKIGEKINGWLNNNRNNTKLLDDFKKISQNLDDIAKTVYDRVKERVLSRIKEINGEICVMNEDGTKKFELKKKQDDIYFMPLRKVFVSGDDITFICDGRIAHDLAETALSCFKEEKVHKIGNVSACAGIAIIHSHEPFYQGFRLAYQLCESAKEKVKKNNQDICAMDWQIGLLRKNWSIAEMREYLYRASGNILTMRPYFLNNFSDTESWGFLKVLIKELNDQEKWPRNKVKKLAEILRKGHSEVENTLKSWRATNFKGTLSNKILNTNGFLGNQTPLLDAIELLDIYLALG